MAVFKKCVRPLGEMLVEKGFITEARLAEALVEQVRQDQAGGPHMQVGDILVKMGSVTPEQVTTALSQQEVAAEIEVLDAAGEVRIVVLKGYVDAATHDLLEDVLATLLRQGRTSIVLDCAKLNYADSSAIGDILDFAKEALGAGGAVKFSGLQGVAKAVFELLEMDKDFGAFDTRDEAVAAFPQDG